MKNRKLKFIDLFAGIGGMRIGFESACRKNSIGCECVFSSEIKEHALRAYKDYFGNHIVHGDITKISADEIPDFDFLLAGFPCQAFSSAGRRMGFLDTRGTLFFEIERILKAKKPHGFILENVEGLLTHDREDGSKKVGRTFETIMGILKEIGYKVNYKVLNSKDFGLAQDRKRVFIVGTKDEDISLEGFEKRHAALSKFLDRGLPTLDTEFTRLLLKHYRIEDLYGKSIKDKRGGENNIHSWEFGLKGKVSQEQRKLLSMLLRERRKKQWAEMKGIEWMDGMPLTEKEISSFFAPKDLKNILDDLVEKGYLKYEYPKGLVKKRLGNGEKFTARCYHTSKEKGYNIVAGKLSFEINKILDSDGIAPTLVATDLSRIAVSDGGGIRRLALKECLRLFGFPSDFNLSVSENEGYDLCGNAVAVPVVEAIAERVIRKFK